MKIDLHLHTIQTKKGDGTLRNVDSDKFKDQLKKAGVGLAAITNHNKFDEEQFDSFVDDRYYILLPGIEVDFKEEDAKKRSQANIIFSNNEEGIKYASSLSKFLKNTSPEKPVPISDLLKEIGDKKTIIFLDKKQSKKTMVSEDSANFILKNKSDNTCVLYDANNVRTHRILMAMKLNSLIGSDVQSWEGDTYVDRDSVDLIETQWKIDNFDTFFTLLKEGSAQHLLEKLEVEEYVLQISKDKVKIKILKSGINIIIGDKATGKSNILNEIKNKLPNNRFSYFSEDEKKNEFDKIMKDSDKIIDKNNEVRNQVIKDINDIVTLSKDENNSPKEFFDKINRNIQNAWKIIDSKIETKTKENFDNIEKALEKINIWLKYIEDNKINLCLVDVKINQINKSINPIKDDLISIFIKSKINSISQDFSNSLKLNIRNVLGESISLKTNDLSVGLLSLYTLKENIKKKVSSIKETKLEQLIEEVLNETIPTVGNVKLIDENNLLPFNYSKQSEISKDTCGKHKITSKEFKNSMKIFKNVNFENINFFKQYWAKKENVEHGVVFTKRKLYNNETPFKLSSGQESLFVLVQALNSPGDFVILDEPSSRIGTNSIMEYVNDKLTKLRRLGKTIIIATHNSNLGINTLPNNFIFRVKENNSYQTLYSYIYSDYFMDEKHEQNTKHPFNDVIMDILEGGKNPYKIRKDIYDSKILNK